MISDGISDNNEASCATLVAVYDGFGKMLDLVDITSFDQSDISISITNMKDARAVKVLRWTLSRLEPLYDAIEVDVKKE